MIKNFSIIFILAAYYLLLATTTFAQSTPWSIQRDTADAYKLKFWYSNLSASPLTITTDGRIGIGTANPLQLLHVSGTNPLVQISNSSTGFNGIKFTATGGWTTGIGTNQAAGYWYDFSNDLGTTHQLYFNGTNWIFPVGKIGIGTANPSAQLTVVGGNIDIEANRTIYSPGRMHVFGEEILYLLNKSGVVVSKAWGGNGNLSVEGTKNFEIPHPLDPEKRLVHSSLEGPEAAVFYRGEGQLLKGEVEIILPNYFEALTRPDNRTVTLTAKGKTPYLLSTEEVKNGKFKVYGTQPDGKFFWEVKAVRKDVPPLQVEKLKN